MVAVREKGRGTRCQPGQSRGGVGQGEGDGFAYEAKRVDEKSADGVGQHAEAKDVHVSGGDEEVPEEVAGGQSLDHAGAARVAPEALAPVHLPALVVDVDDPEGEGVDGGALDEGDDVDVPVELLGLGQDAVLGREEAGGQRGRDNAAHELVEDGYYDDLVDVQRERGQVEVVGPWLDRVGEGRNRRDWEWILHPEGCWLSVSVLVSMSALERMMS